jgi:hypothetical protein
MNAGSFRQNEKWVYYKHVYYIFWYLCKVDYIIETFIHASSFSFKEVICILEFAGIVEEEKVMLS